MRIVVNLATLKSGGGQNVGLNFLHSLLKTKSEDVELLFLVADKSDIHNVAIQNHLRILSVLPRNPILRMLKELFYVNVLLLLTRVDIIYSYFGVGLFLRKIPQVSGSADSNLYYPEVDFWSHYSGIGRFKKWIIDQYRIWGLKKSSAVIYENEVLEKRGRKIFNLKQTKYIKPSVNFEIRNDVYVLPLVKSRDTKIGLFLCGWQLNKNIMLIPDLARLFSEKGCDFRFIITAPEDNSEICSAFKERVRKFEVEEKVYIVGSIPKEYLASLYGQVDFVFLLSLLESFSNNIIEAWYFNKPLVISDEEWARSICGKGAVYVARDKPDGIVNTVLDVISDRRLLVDILNGGRNQLESYPSIDERTLQELRFIKDVAEKY